MQTLPSSTLAQPAPKLLRRTCVAFIAVLVSLPLAHGAPLEPAPEEFISYAIPGKATELAHLRNLYWNIYKAPISHLSSLWFPWMTGIEMAPAGKLSADKRIEWAKNLDKIKIFSDGYVSVGQHYSHAHDGGWPFPLWPQIFEPAQFRGYTAGWHFQDQTEGFIRVHYMEPIIAPAGHSGDAAIEHWMPTDMESEGRPIGSWRLRVNGGAPSLTLRDGHVIQADLAPFLQIRQRSDFDPVADSGKITMQWKREGDSEFSSDREIKVSPTSPDPWERASELNHCLFETWKHPLWKGNIVGLRFLFPPLQEGATYEVDSIFTAFDTRHPVTNTGYILGAADYFRWTGDTAFLSRNIEKMRKAMDFCRGELGGDAHKFIRAPWVGHDGLSGYVFQPDGSWKRRYGVGIGNNYWDLVPFGGDDMYATTYFYAALLALEEIEDWISKYGKDIALPPAQATAADLGKLAAEVKEVVNKHFWNEEAGRFIACIDREGVRHDFGYTFVNLEAVYYGLANAEHSKLILDWIAGDRVVEGDTSTGKDIYRFRFGPRSSTLRNATWYFWAWPGVDKPWGGQVQDGGAVLGFAYHDLMSRLKYRGANDAGDRMDGMLAWLSETQAEGGFRPYYAADPSRGTMQGGGPDGGLGIDVEFIESELWPSVLLSGFAGFRPTAAGFSFDPNLPEKWPSLKIQEVAFRDSTLTFLVSHDKAEIRVKGETPGQCVVASPNWALENASGVGPNKSDIHPVNLKDGAILTFRRK
ncbi:MAG: glycosyl hydrolase family 65 protein [Terrimicrobiaceae bacterium]